MNEIEDLRARLAQAERERDKARKLADAYERDWCEAKAQFGTDSARLSARAREAESIASLAMREGLAAVEAERSRADRLEVACAAMREALVAVENGETGLGGKPSPRVSAALDAPDAGARLLAYEPPAQGKETPR